MAFISFMTFMTLMNHINIAMCNTKYLLWPQYMPSYGSYNYDCLSHKMGQVSKIYCETVLPLNACCGWSLVVWGGWGWKVDVRRLLASKEKLTTGAVSHLHPYIRFNRVQHNLILCGVWVFIILFRILGQFESQHLKIQCSYLITFGLCLAS